MKKRMELAEEVTKKKQDVLEKFDKMMKKNQGISVETIKELFPDDNELIDRVVGKLISNNSIKTW